jgi:hypothetical protein
LVGTAEQEEIVEHLDAKRRKTWEIEGSKHAREICHFNARRCSTPRPAFANACIRLESLGEQSSGRIFGQRGLAEMVDERDQVLLGGVSDGVVGRFTKTVSTV